MPEGHTVHRTANSFNKAFAGQLLSVDSPQGRFSSGAEQLSGTRMLKATAIGKQLFVRFDSGLWLRVHLGIYGKWRWHKDPEALGFLAELPVGEVRARFYTAQNLAELRGPTVCEVLTEEEVAAVRNRLGPDPLNQDPTGAECERFVARVQRSGKTIGALLMDQSVISGIGNVYRAEILFRAQINPYTPGNAFTRQQLEGLWADSVALMRVGVKTGFMITRDHLFAKRPAKVERNYVYKREGQECRQCGTSVSIALMESRKLYWCGSCQA